MVRRLKKDVLKELPDKTRTVIPLQIENEKEYTKAKDDFITWLTAKSAAKAKRAASAQTLVQMGYLKRLAAELKMKAVFKWIDDFLEESNNKLVLYGIHRNILNSIHEKYKKQSIILLGGLADKKRKLAVESFQNLPNFRIFIANISAAGEGITLTAASDLAFVELDWVSGKHIQAEDRIHRIGQKNAANIYYLIAQNTIEEELCELIQKKQKVVSAILDGDDNINNLDIYSKLVNSIKGDLI